MSVLYEKIICNKSKANITNVSRNVPERNKTNNINILPIAVIILMTYTTKIKGVKNNEIYQKRTI